MSPSVPVSPAQAQRFHLAMCERLGVDPAITSRVEADVIGDDGIVTLSVRLPGDEVYAMWNATADG